MMLLDVGIESWFILLGLQALFSRAVNKMLKYIADPLPQGAASRLKLDLST